MNDLVEQVLEDFSRGRLSRRQAAKVVLGAAMAAAGAGSVVASPEDNGATFRATGLNHLGLRVSDVGRSRDFYRRHLGLGILEDSAPGNCFLSAGHNYMGLFRSSQPAMDHFCFTVDGYQPDHAVERLRQAGLEPRRRQNRVYFDDPDGIEVQVAGPWDSWPGPLPPDAE